MTTLLTFVPTTTLGEATLTVAAETRGPHAVNPRLFGKFCEHLGANIYHGMEAQVLFNPTMARWRFSAGDNHPDGGVREESDRAAIERQVAWGAERFGWPDAARVVEAYYSGCAFGWFPVGAGTPDDVRLSPEVGPHGGRAQRIELLGEDGSEAGIGQWTYLPLHRTRRYLFRMVARAVGPGPGPGPGCTLRLGLAPVDPVGSDDGATGGQRAQHAAPLHEDTRTVASVCTVMELGTGWQTVTGTLELPADANAAGGALVDALYAFTITGAAPAHVVIDRVLLYPDDHVNGADPDVIALLREARLPLLRWPGGNFVSGYHWRDGVGPVDNRPTVPNPAWGGLEFNLFGTDEFIAFCRAVGCEPMICMNAGSGTAAEAAAWVEYCNGGPETAVGKLRAANGHPAPYNVRVWEIGNEIYGHWQVSWTTPGGNVDRYRRFREAMLAVDPSLFVIGCGHGNEPNSVWNQTLIEAAAAELGCITDHILTGGSVDAKTDPVELYHAFMGYPRVLEGRYRELAGRMRAAGIPAPRLAITELQLFAHFRGEATPDGPMRPELLPSPDTMAEALSLALIVHTCIRLGDFVELLTHSATVNHGGGLRKQRERVYANPVHYAHVMGHALAGGTPVAVELACETFSTGHDFAHIPPQEGVPVLDAMAVLTEAGDLVLQVVHRGASCGPVELAITVAGFAAAAEAEVVTLAGETWHDRNTLEAPEKIVPEASSVSVEDGGRVRLRLAPFSLTQVRLRKDGA